MPSFNQEFPARFTHVIHTEIYKLLLELHKLFPAEKLVFIVAYILLKCSHTNFVSSSYKACPTLLVAPILKTLLDYMIHFSRIVPPCLSTPSMPLLLIPGRNFCLRPIKV